MFSLAVFTSTILFVFRFIRTLPKLESKIETEPYSSIFSTALPIVLQGVLTEFPQLVKLSSPVSETYIEGNMHGIKRFE
jgi:hypothetical protein